MGRNLRLDTAQGNHIANEQGEGVFTHGERVRFADMDRDYGLSPDFRIRTEATPLYNCHGLAFAGRRTGIHDNETIHQLLSEDAYREVQPESVLPGDVLVYFDDQGQPEHSAIVVDAPRDPRLIFVPLVVSKWGNYREIIHRANRCPYSFAKVRYYRVLHD
jgi:hypothetical protein